MESLKQLLYLLLYFYLGFIAYICYNIIFYYQKRFLIIKAIVFFIIIACIWIHLSNKYEIDFNYFFIISFVLGLFLSQKIFEKYLNKLNEKYIKALVVLKDRCIYLIKIAITPTIYYKFKCYIFKKIYYHKYPWLKPLDLRRLF